MQALGSRKKGKLFAGSKTVHQQHTFDDTEQSWKYLYKNPPTGEVTIDEFETYAKNRTALLHKIENWRAIGVSADDLYKRISDEDRLEYHGLHADYVRKDFIAHNVLRIAYSRRYVKTNNFDHESEELRRFFVQQESILFENRLRSGYAGPDEILKLNSIPVQEVSVTEKQQHAEELRYMHNQVKMFNTEMQHEVFDQARIWKTHFTNALPLVNRRRVYISGGFAYLFKPQLLSVLTQHFRTSLAEKVLSVNRYWPYLKEIESERVVPFLSAVTVYESQFKNVEFKGGQVIPEQIDTLAQQSFPLCMKVLHRELRGKHHLKHQGRQQFGLFLKGIGLSLDDALRFWREEFTRSMTADKFEKNYSYNIRHNYGKEGKRTNYTPYGCMKIITGLAAPTSEDHHGCPFKNFSSSALKGELKAFQRDQVDEIIQLVEGKHYQVACRKYFDLTHPSIKDTNAEMAREDDGTPFNHPNAYYQKSRQLLDKK